MPLQQHLDNLKDDALHLQRLIGNDPNPSGPLQQNGEDANDKADEVKSDAENALLELPSPSTGLGAATGDALQQATEIKNWATTAQDSGTSNQEKADCCERCRISIDGSGHLKDMIDNGP